MVYAVIDTNIFVSSFITNNPSASTRRVVNVLFDRKITPLYNNEILKEYDEVLHRPKFKLKEKDIVGLLSYIKKYGKDANRLPFESDMPDESDRVFYEVSLSEESSFLVTGNLKHFPRTPKVVTAAQLMDIIEREEQSNG